MRWAYLLVEVGLVFIAAQIGKGITSHFSVITASILKLQSRTLSDRDFFLTWIVFLVVHFIIFLCNFQKLTTILVQVKFPSLLPRLICVRTDGTKNGKKQVEVFC